MATISAINEMTNAGLGRLTLNLLITPSCLPSTGIAYL
jgi:hypothetical protein